MDHRKKKIKTNPVALATNTKISHAIQLFEDFRGEKPAYIDKVNVKAHDVGLLIGECDGILYTTSREGRKEKYIHKFKKRSRPLLVSSYDGKQLYLLKGAYQFTERGIIDK